MSQKFYWRAKLGKDTPWICVMTWFGPPLVDGEELDRSPRWQAKVRTEQTSRAILMGGEIPIEVDGVNLRNLEKITLANYLYLRDHSAWAEAHAPHMPDANPKRKIDKRGKSVW